MELVLQSIHLVLIFVQKKLCLKHDQFLVLHLMLLKIVHQHKHLKMVGQLEFVQYRDEQLHMKLPKKNIYFEIE
jgi:hypothetical protein